MFLSLADTDIAFPLGTAACYQVRDLPCLLVWIALKVRT